MTKSLLHLGSKTFETTSIFIIKYKLNSIVLGMVKNFIFILEMASQVKGSIAPNLCPKTTPKGDNEGLFSYNVKEGFES